MIAPDQCHEHVGLRIPGIALRAEELVGPPAPSPGPPTTPPVRRSR